MSGLHSFNLPGSLVVLFVFVLSTESLVNGRQYFFERLVIRDGKNPRASLGLSSRLQFFVGGTDRGYTDPYGQRIRYWIRPNLILRELFGRTEKGDFQEHTEKPLLIMAEQLSTFSNSGPVFI
ncbi:hypothetical protein RRG08_041138 [Elysia crispata]|uniref:Uncharacterized protein n=1 Tax=Elysia crispata TaxID=231223 RepID=A0AAE0XY93_9GAST|nr:hypothetical protein RRG08_041138 [Elysia crispata]